MPGLIAMTSVFAVVGIEMFFAMRGAGHIHASDFDAITMEDGQAGGHHHHGVNSTGPKPGASRRSVTFKRRPPDILLPTVSSSDNLVAGRSPSMGEQTPLPTPNPNRDSLDSVADDLELDDLSAQNPTSGLLSQPKRTPSLDSLDPLADTNLELIKPDRKALLQCLLLEAGILFHSVFIGMALSVTPAPGFYVLLVAISFHQTFEGLALGSRISALTFPPRAPQPWLMALAYGTTTPLGQAIGLAIHSMYDPASETGLLSVGIMNAISSGLLLFAGLVELLAADFLSDESYETLTGKRRYQACASVLAGAMLMALVGAWA